MNLDQLKQNACKTLALIDLIERSKSRARNIWAVQYYTLFGSTQEREEAVNKQNAVTARLEGYLEKLIQ
ncbi:hypothetical protein [Pedobacter punctiformis]|uniref:Uncharacterized protein n=1 Tax=Pedobacter punctiformis TaxID=3004097 RepID=A0ABT4LB33_9SPHI|nr:hypothetical protein [Pedobacter sp. HCMS5-2]MCZ4244922.1 hypothetical protein [Pedobacter sp. HCMS5-2]